MGRDASGWDHVPEHKERRIVLRRAWRLNSDSQHFKSYDTGRQAVIDLVRKSGAPPLPVTAVRAPLGIAFECLPRVPSKREDAWFATTYDAWGRRQARPWAGGGGDVSPAADAPPEVCAAPPVPARTAQQEALASVPMHASGLF